MSPTDSTTTGSAPAPSVSHVPVQEEEFYSSWSLFLVCTLLILSLWTSYYLSIRRIRAINETIVSIIAGMFVGLVIRLAQGDEIRQMLTFKHTLFFNLLLPPIILNSGYELKQENFFRNFGSILTFAFLGTFISAVGVGVLVYIWSRLGLENLNLDLIECLIFGSTLSATDPVTILAIFNQYKVDPKLYTIIFGESLLNDAVSIVMYETLSQFHGEEITLASLMHGIGIFLFTFTVSLLLGIIFGLAMSLILKHSQLSHFPKIESCLVALSAYTCYFFSNGIQMSGIVSLLFCGITLKHYAYHTMSRRTQRASKSIFQVLAQLSENFIFVYLGLSLFTSPPPAAKLTTYFKPLFVCVTTVAVIFTRYAAVFPLSEALNFFFRHARGQRADEIPHSYQMMLFWAGLRGAVGVALAAGFKGDSAEGLRTTVLLVVVLTVVLFGGTTARMLSLLGIRTGVEDEGASSDEDEEPLRYAWLGPAPPGRRSSSASRRLPSSSRNYLPASPRPSNASKIGVHYGRGGPSSYNHQAQPPDPSRVFSPGVANAGTIFSSASSDAYDSDGEVLPLAPTAAHDASASVPTTPGVQQEGEDGRWFQTLDERYLLPLFSNATASRTFHARRAQRRSATSAHVGSASGQASYANSPEGSEDEGGELDLTSVATNGATGSGGVQGQAARLSEQSRLERGLGSPVLRSASAGPYNGPP